METATVAAMPPRCPTLCLRLVPRIGRFLGSLHPAKLALLGYLSYIAIGWLLLSLPIARTGPIPSLDNLFTATSAVSTTGLTTVSTAGSYTPFGQAVVLLLIQFGGIGYMTLGSFIVLARGGPLSGARRAVGETVFSLPQGFTLEGLIRSAIVFTLLIEAAGALALWPVFAQAGLPTPLWSAVFHSVSAFCTAGFSLYDDSMTRFAGSFWAQMIISILSYLGAIGFIVCLDAWKVVTRQARSLTLTSRVILWSTVLITLAGAVLIFVAEPSIRSKAPHERLLAAFFQAMTATTTVGFNTVGIGDLSRASLLILTVLMVIGSSPSGTGGGLKVTTFSALLGVMWSALRGRQDVRFGGAAVPIKRVWTAVAGLGFYLAVLVAGTFLLELTETGVPLESVLFESSSALGTVGLSTGLTSSLSVLGRVIVIALMFCGRVGPLTFGMALVSARDEGAEAPRQADLAV